MPGMLFLDRDGVINTDSPEYIKSIEEWLPIAGSLDAIARLCSAGFRIVVVTNQSGIARGLYDERTLSEIHAHMTKEVESAGGRLAGIYHCPHGPDVGCACRKPATGLIDRACAELGCSARGAPLIGDRLSDLRAARAAGCRPVLIGNEASISSGEPDEQWSDVVVYQDLARAASALIAEFG